ncbi:sigma-70 region 4 domain-containing protein, partial [Spirillospora sp. NPDC049652]
RHGPPPDVPPPDESSVHLVAALAELPEPQRRALVMHHMGGYTISEIADLEGVAEGTVKARLSRGRIRLAAMIVAAALVVAAVLGVAELADAGRRTPATVAPGPRPLVAADLFPRSGTAGAAHPWKVSASPFPAVPDCGGPGPDFSGTVQRLTVTADRGTLDGRAGELRQAQFFVFPTLRAARRAMALLEGRAGRCGIDVQVSKPRLGENALSIDLRRDGPARESHRAVVARQGLAVLVFSDHRRGGAAQALDLAMLDVSAREVADHLRALGYRS